MATCEHGFESGQCLICQTLGSTGRGGATTGRTTTKARHRAASDYTGPSGGPVEVVGSGPRSSGGRGAGRVVMALVVAVLAVLAFWLVAGAIFAVLRLLEIVIVAAVAGVLGYRLGRARGRRER